MEQTLGKRIVANRKRLGLTQDQLAERLGVTAQAVSKWENDQSCPDISMLPQLARIFGISIDALLSGGQEETVHEAEVVHDPHKEVESEHHDVHFHWGDETGSKDKWEANWGSGRQNSLGLAVWVLLTGGLLLTSTLLSWGAGFWDILWPSALLVFGLWGLFPRFSFFRLGCGFFGGYFLLCNLHVKPFDMGTELLLPIILVLLGLSLAADALRKSIRSHFEVKRNGKKVYPKKEKGKFSSSFSVEGETFSYSNSFGEDYRSIQVPRLSGGNVEVTFGETTIDLSDCKEVAEGCAIRADCSFGELNFLVPRRYRIDCESATSFASLNIQGEPDPAPAGVIRMNASVNFGQIKVQYI